MIQDSVTVLENIFGQIPLIENLKVRYERGTRESFDLYIAQNNYEVKYPLIWEVMPNKTEVISDNKHSKKLTLLLAKKSNNERARDYEVIKREFNILKTLLNFVIEGFEKSNSTFFDRTYTYEERPNYYENSKSVQTDVLNVIVLDINIDFKFTSCLNTIIWQ
jgi:hypothetical protein